MGKKNLAYQKKVIIGNTVPIEHCYAALEKGSKDVLTDGITGDPASCYSGDWAHFYRGVGRTLTVDLGGEFAVSGMDIGFIQDKNMGIYSPETVKLLLSVNGVDFYEVSSVDSPYPASFEQKVRAVYSSELSKPLRARYARVDFFVEVNSFCDELRVFGDACDGETQELTGEAVKEEYVGSYESNDCLGGIRDVCLMYFGYWPENERTARLTKEDFMPYLAYVDRNGKIIDTMFDGSMFLMVMGKCPSGGSLGYHGGPSFLSDWEYILNELFTSGQNLSAINEAYGEVKKSLGLPKEAKHKIYLTAPVPKISLEPFGDMNGDGIEEKILSTDDCIAAYAWYVDEFTRRFKAQQYENIEVDGWFWNNESASRAARDDEEYFAAGCVAELHKRGYKCVMIPYFQAGGTEKARKIGFDCITMQPGLSFQEALGVNAEGMMEDFTELCKKYGFGIELEMHHGVNNDEQKYKYGKLFDEYLRACIKNGMMTDTVHTYYQAAGPGAFYRCAVSEDDYQRNMYDKLYKFYKKITFFQL